MKKNTSHKTIVLPITQSAFNNQGFIQDQECYKGKVILNDTDTLNLDAYIKDGGAVRIIHDNFKKNMRCEETREKINLEPVEIKIAHLIQWSEVVWKAQSSASCFKIHYGYNGQKSIIPLFQLGFLTRMGHVSGKQYKYKPEFNNPVCTYSLEEGFLPIGDAEKDTLIENYNKLIFIRHHAKDAADHYSKVEGDSTSTSFESDPRAIIFSFQEIFTFYDITNNESDPAKKYCHSLYLHHAMDYFHDPENKHTDRYKHSVLFSREVDINKALMAGEKVLIQSDKAANLAHLSPPNQDTLIFEIQ